MNLLAYGYRIIHPFDPIAQGDLEFNCQPQIYQLYCISTFQIHHMDYPGQGFNKLKYTNALTLTYSERSIPS